MVNFVKNITLAALLGTSLSVAAVAHEPKSAEPAKPDSTAAAPAHDETKTEKAVRVTKEAVKATGNVVGNVMESAGKGLVNVTSDEKKSDEVKKDEKTLGEKATEAKDSVKEGAQKAADATKEKATEVKDSVKEGAQKAGDKVKETATEAKDKASH